MKNLSKSIFLTVLLAVFVSSPGMAEESPLVGEWINMNGETRACTRFEVSQSVDGKAELVWWGKTHPKDSRYGPFPLAIDDSGKGAVARHVTGFSIIDFTLKMRGSKVSLKMETEYTDDSGRGNIEIEEKFEKK